MHLPWGNAMPIVEISPRKIEDGMHPTSNTPYPPVSPYK